MLLKDKIAVVYRAGGGVGSAIARKFALEGSLVYITARRFESIKKLADEISRSGGTAKAAKVDALEEKAIEGHLDSIALHRRGTSVCILTRNKNAKLPAGWISYEDFAAAILDEIEWPRHIQRRFTVGY